MPVTSGAGGLDQRVTFERSGTIPGPGGDVAGWTPVATVWAAVWPVSGRERLAAGREEGATLYRVKVRRRNGLDAGMRILWRGLVLNVRAVPDPGPRAAFLVLDAEAGVAT